MKTIGLILTVVGVLALLIGLVVCVVTLTSDYASSACTKAEADKSKFNDAKMKCASLSEPLRSECVKRETSGLTTQADCESNTSFMRTQLIMGIAPVVIGFLLAIVGFFLWRRKKAEAIA